MFTPLSSFTGYSVNNLEEAKAFYTQTLELELTSEEMGLEFRLPGEGGTMFLYQKSDHQPATFTVLNFIVEDIETAVETLKNKGITFESYTFDFGSTDEKGIMRGKATGDGPDIAWFKDPAGNVLSVLEN